MKKSSKTDWQGLSEMTDEDIDYSDIPPLADAFFERAKIVRPTRKVEVSVKLDSDILEWFKTETDDWEDRMQAALRLYVETHKMHQKADNRP